MEQKEQMVEGVQAVKQVAPEDLQRGDYVALSRETVEWLVCDEAAGARRLQVQPVTMRAEGAGVPLKVVEVCVPFLLVKLATGRHTTLDLRRHHVVRLPRAYGKAAFKCYRQQCAPQT